MRKGKGDVSSRRNSVFQGWREEGEKNRRKHRDRHEGDRQKRGWGLGREGQCQCVPLAQSCLTLSPTGSSVHGILQASILQWVAILFSRGSS